MAPGRILIVRLPCHKVFPAGPVYLHAALHAAAPSAALRLLDLALESRRGAWPAVKRDLRAFHPDLVAFSWRDIQIFSPQDADGGLRDAFIFFHHPSLLHKAAAAFRGLRDMVLYRSSLATNLRLLRRTARKVPRARVALGGPSARIFGELLRGRLPRRVEIFSEQGLDAFFRAMDLPAPAEPLEPGIDIPFLAATFPGFPAYRGDVVAVQTKQGCPQHCLYCLYGFLEGRAVRRRDSRRVVDEIEAWVRHAGTRRFWLADAQLLSVPGDKEHLASILAGVIDRGLSITWSGYLRVHELEPNLARLMVRTGLSDLEVSVNSGAQEVIDRLRLGFTVEGVERGLAALRDAGYAGRVLLNLSLNAPGETTETLRATCALVRRVTALFGDERVIPVVFFLAIQPHTGLEETALAAGHIRAGYNPLSVLPWNVLRLIYNPPPLGRTIGRACVAAFAGGREGAGRRVLAELGRITGG